MKTLTQYIKESVIKESVKITSSDFLLLKTYEDAEKYFNDRNGLLEKFGIDKVDLKNIYDIAAINNKTAPFVGCYKSKNVFVMRRWVDSKLSDWMYLAKSNNTLAYKRLNTNLEAWEEWFWKKIPGVYAGPHNTSLKEDGSYNPSAEDMELVIAFAVNKKLYPALDDITNIKFVCNDTNNKESQKEENLLNYYQEEYKFINNCADALQTIDSKLYKLVTGKNKVTDDWIKFGRYNETNDRINTTPKTDLISENGKYKISLKKAHGSQLMSGSYNESLATIMSVANNTLSKEDLERVKEIFSAKWAKFADNQKGISVQKKNGSNEIKEKIANSEKLATDINKFLNDICKSNPNFKKALLYEAITGEYKFGKNSPLAANYVFVWSDKEHENKLYTCTDYINLIINNVKIKIEWKTGGSTSMQTLRIITQ